MSGTSQRSGSGQGGSAGRAVLIAAQSGRALAAAARRAGYRPRVADLFADDDTRRIAERVVRIETGPACAIGRRPLLAALEALEDDGDRAVGVVVGSGFEDRPKLLGALEVHHLLLGTGGEAVARVKDPAIFAAACAAAAIPHPALGPLAPGAEDVPSDERCDDRARWLVKRRGGAGGDHVHPFRPERRLPARGYLQRLVPGTPFSATFVGTGRDAGLVGFAEQVTAPTAGAPYRFGGLVGPADVEATIAAAVVRAGRELATAFGVRGLFSVDFLVDGMAWWCLELNPRPGASLEVFDRSQVPLFAAHVAGCAGGGIEGLDRPPATRCASLTIFAEAAIPVLPAIEWPDWIRDRPTAGEAIGEGRPVATVVAEAATAEGALALARRRVDDIRRRIGENNHE